MPVLEFQQKKEWEQVEEGRRACTKVQHDCHLSLQFHSFSRKENHIGTCQYECNFNYIPLQQTDL